ncbi:sulfatase, partial [Bacteroides cellulosilyticus]|nr:sulfatase [Bacteroides cellulosilyticus]
FTTIHPHSDNGLAEACGGFLEQNHTKPFFLVAGFDNPHNICEYARSQNLPWGNIEDLPQNEGPGLPLNFAKNPYDADVISYEQSLNYSAYPTRNYTPDDW